MLIVRDMLLHGKKTFKEFSASPEKIAPGILSSRLKWLEENGLMTKRKLPGNRKENIYLLEEKGIALAPVLLELVLWGDANVKQQNPEMYSLDEAGFDRDKASVLEEVVSQYRQMVASLID
jgi:DNA-binding HxlR family transcriptional regulator